MDIDLRIAERESVSKLRTTALEKNLNYYSHYSIYHIISIERVCAVEDNCIIASLSVKSLNFESHTI